VTTVEKIKPADPDFHLYFLVAGLSDIFSLGVIVYEMAAGNRPFLGESLATISNRILAQMPIPIDGRK
jgi:serine/threonine protein kinase